MKIYRILLSFFFLIILSMPLASKAAVVFFDTDALNVAAGDTIVVNVRLNTEGKNINTVDGKIILPTLDSEVMIKEFSLANSVLTIWPLKPSLSPTKKSVSFVGGVPGGFNSANAVLFKIIITPNKAGLIDFSIMNALAYLNDGLGTLAQVGSQNLAINIAEKQGTTEPVDNWKNLIASDNTPPESFEVDLSQDSGVNDGKRFIDFYTVDNQTGVDYYEIIEGDSAPIRSGSPYILQNQNSPVKISVVAHDKAGNLRMAMYQPISKPALDKKDQNNSVFIVKIIVIVIVLLALLVAWFVFRFKHEK